MERIIFKIINRKRIFILDIDPVTTIGKAKDKICELLRREKTEITAIYNGKILLDEDNFIDKFGKCIYIYYEFKKSEGKKKKNESILKFFKEKITQLNEALVSGYKDNIEKLIEKNDLISNILIKEREIEILQEKFNEQSIRENRKIETLLDKINELSINENRMIEILLENTK